MNKQLAKYKKMWRQVPAQLGFLLPEIFLGLTVPILALSLMAVGIGTLIITVGVFVVIATLYLARFYGQLEIVRLRAAHFPAFAKPKWSETRGLGLWKSMRTVLFSPAYWRYFLFTMIELVLAPLTGFLTLIWVILVLAYPAYLATMRLEGSGQIGYFLTGSLGLSPVVIDLIIYGLISLLTLATLPFVTRGLTSAQGILARALLSRSANDTLRADNQKLSQARTAALNAEGRSRRQLERDIHDGPQQQLLRLQMDLALAQRHIDQDPDNATQVLGQAQILAQQTLDDLRRLSKGIAPPLLQDRGLVVALRALLDRSVIPASLVTDLDSSERFEPAVEQNLFFIVSELLTNATKHSQANRVEVSLAHSSAGLSLSVSDDGRGGAVAPPRGGLSGLQQRILGLGGTMSIDSPRGGPTHIEVKVPC